MKKHNINSLTIVGIIILLFTNFQKSMAQKRDIFDKNNLLAWCIVPFDSQKRGPEERAKMLSDLGIKKFAYDWREEHVPQFDEEWRALQKYGIELSAFWMMTGQEPEKDRFVQEIFDFLKRNGIKTQIWLLVGEPANFPALSQEEKVKTLSLPIKYIAEKAKELGCEVALYNHGGWFGEPENQLEIIDFLKMKNIGIVYNFHHARFHHAQFKSFYPKMLPKLMALNIAGLQSGVTEHAFRVGQGDVEKDMLMQVWKSKYKGPIGILNHDHNEDAKKGLMDEMEGLKKILEEIGNKKARKSFD